MTTMTKTKGKNHRKTTPYDGYEFDSNEEKEFYIWMREAISHNLIEPVWGYQPRTFELFDKTTVPVVKTMKTKLKTVDKHLLHSHTYDPDFRLRFTQKMRDLIGSDEYPYSFVGFKFIKTDVDIYIDIKGTFNKNKRSFSIDQKWIYECYGIYVHEIVPTKLFKATWCPEELRWTPKTKKPRAKYYDLPVITDFI